MTTAQDVVNYSKNLVGKKVTVPQIIINGKLIGGYEDLLEYFEQHSIFGMQQ